MRPTRPTARASLLTAAGVTTVTFALAASGAVSFAGAAAHPRTRPAARPAPVPLVTARTAELTRAQQASALRYWTAARMTAARPMGPPRHPAAALARTRGAERVLRPASPTAASPVAGVARTDTATAHWPGGGAVQKTTGKVFFTMDGHDFVCTAASVTSANADIVVTAAHCVKNGTGSWASNWAFVPAYARGARPYGTWTARQFFVASQWSQRADDNEDVAFVALNPRGADGQTLHLGDVVGGQAIAFGLQPAQEFAFGYPAESPYNGGVLYYCSGHTRPDSYQSSQDTGLHCALTAGSSGGPWLTGFDPSTGTGTITSVSSYKYSTDQATLYGPLLGPTAQALFDQAQHS